MKPVAPFLLEAFYTGSGDLDIDFNRGKALLEGGPLSFQGEELFLQRVTVRFVGFAHIGILAAPEGSHHAPMGSLNRVPVNWVLGSVDERGSLQVVRHATEGFHL